MQDDDKVLEEINVFDEVKKKNSMAFGVKDYIHLCLVVLITFAVCRYVFALHKIPSSSMEPTIKTHSLAICWRLPYLLGDPAPKYGDIVSFRDTESNNILIKRVIGLPGDTVSFSGGHVYRNGVQLSEPYVRGVTGSPTESFTVPPGHMFVLGDNRNNSKDSRFKDKPFIPFENIYAKELFSVYAPIFT